MSKMQTQRRAQAKQARLEIVSELFLRQYSERKIREEVMKRLGLKTYSVSTVHNDIKTIIEELQEKRLDNAEYAVRLELERIDEACRELWEQWEKTTAKGPGYVVYISEIRQQLQERRKLLGLYSAEKRETKIISEEFNREELEAELRRLEILTD